jgi:hypothetical protein
MTVDDWRENIMRRIDNLELRNQELLNRVVQLEIRSATEKVSTSVFDKRLSNIENSLRWMSRGFGAAVIAYVAQFVLQGGLTIVQ